MSPNDPFALATMVEVNFCECVREWSRNVDEQLAIGAEALEKYLRYDPSSRFMLRHKANLHALRGRFDEALLIVDSNLKRHPGFAPALAERAYYLLKLGRPREAAIAIADVRDRRDLWPDLALEAAIHYALADYARAGASAQAAKAQMSPNLLGNSNAGAVGLTLVAAEARLGNLPRAQAAFPISGRPCPASTQLPRSRSGCTRAPTSQTLRRSTMDFASPASRIDYASSRPGPATALLVSIALTAFGPKSGHEEALRTRRRNNDMPFSSHCSIDSPVCFYLFCTMHGLTE